MITLYRIIELYGADPREVKFVRHGNKEIQILETFLNDLPRFEAYQAFQRAGRFGKAKAIAVFAPYHKTTALFLGLWNIQGYTSDFDETTLNELRSFNLPEAWFDGPDRIRYELTQNNAFNELSQRLVIEWGSATVAWVQSRDKAVVELKGLNSIGDFQSFALVDLTYHDLTKLVLFPNTNLTWMKALSSVNGVYLIRDKASGKLYVGSAYGDQGIYGRWSSYVRNFHGGNLGLQDLDPTTWQLSILEIVPPTASAHDVIECENRWKEKLGTRQFGLNKN